jgi:hypothetical protein
LVRACSIATRLRAGTDGRVRRTEPRRVERRRSTLHGVAQGSGSACFFEHGLHPTVMSGHCRWQHRHLEPLERRTCGANRVACPQALRSGPGSSEHEPTLSNRPSRHSCRRGGFRASESRGRRQSATRWLPRRGEGRSRPEPNPPAMSNQRGAQAPQRRGGASGERRESRGLATSSSSRIRTAAKGNGRQDDSGVGNDAGEETVRSVSGKGIRPNRGTSRPRPSSSRWPDPSGNRAAVATPMCPAAALVQR